MIQLVLKFEEFRISIMNAKLICFFKTSIISYSSYKILITAIVACFMIVSLQL